MASTYEGARAELSVSERPPLRETWPLRRSDALLFLAVFAGLTAIWSGIGLLLTGPLEDSALVQMDQDVSQWFADRRTPALDDWADSRCAARRHDRQDHRHGHRRRDHAGGLAVLAGAADGGAGRSCWRRRCSSPTTWIVGRPRPDVARLEESPVDSSFPSGHTAAAAAYGAIVVVDLRRTPQRRVRAITVVVIAVAVPVIVGLSRTYRACTTSPTSSPARSSACRRPRRVACARPVGRQVARRTVTLTVVVLVVAALAGIVAFVGSAIRALPDPIDPAAEERAVVRSLQRHPRLRRFLRQRLDRRPAGGFLLTVSFL